MITWTNAYVNYFGEICFSKGYNSKKAAMMGRTKSKQVEYLGSPIKIYIPIKK